MSPPALKLSRREQNKTLRRKHIIDVAVGLFSDNGYESVSIDEIAEAAEIGRATFFNYFPKKEGVLHGYRQSIYDEMHEFARLQNGDCGKEMLLQYFRRLTNIIEREGDRYRMLHEVLSTSSDLRNDDGGRYQRVFRHYRRFVDIAVANNELPKGLDCKLFSEILRDVWQGNLHEWVMRRKPKSLEQRVVKKIEILFSVSI